MKLYFKKIAVVIAFTILSGAVNAQYFKIRKFNEENLTFFQLTGKTVAEQQINTFLSAAELQLLPGKYKQSPFEQIRPAKGSTQGITGLNYTILTNTSQVFSVEVNSEYTSASLNESTNVYNFDAATGKVITFRDLVTEAGYVAINKIVNDSRKKKLSVYLKTLKDTNGENKEAYATYQECLNDMDNNELNQDDLKFKKDGLLLTKKSCSPQHYFQALEDQANIYNNKLTAKFLEPYLNAYGKCMLAVKKERCALPARTVLHEGTYIGKMNHQYPITLLVTNVSKDKVFASYFYDKVGKEIGLRCTFEKGTLKMKEENKMSTVFELSLQPDGKLSGTWSNGKNTYPVELQ